MFRSPLAGGAGGLESRWAVSACSDNDGYRALVTDSPTNPRMSFETHADPDLQAGAYANAPAIWHTAHEVTFDFLVSSEPPQQARTEDGEDVIRAPHRLLTRIRIPPTAGFDIIRPGNQNLTLYEQRFGQIRPRGAQAPLYPPDDQAAG